MSTKIFLLLLMSLSLVQQNLNAAQDKGRSSGVLVDSYPSSLSDKMIIKPSGEVQVELSRTMLVAERRYRVSLVFPDKATYKEILEITLVDVDLQDLDMIIFRDNTELVQLQKEDFVDLTLADLMARVQGNIGSDVILRGVMLLGEGVTLGINLHAEDPLAEDVTSPRIRG